MGVGTALLLGLVARQRGAGGQRTLTTMLSTMAHALSEVMVRYDGQPDAPTADTGLHGFAAGYRLYEAADGEWVFLAAVTPRDWLNLVDATAAHADLGDARFATPELRAQHDDALVDALAAMFVTRPAQDWEKELCAAGVACVVAERTPVDGNMYDEGALGRQWGYVTTVEHPVIGEHTRLTPLVQFSRSGTVVEAGCAVGQHTDAVLHEIGYDDDRIAALRAAGIVGGPGRTEPAGGA
jgi:crotonobetainyl-CoA:carnitine CoA-transferase CaiB-like acyl-CoA transferase